MEKNTKKLPVYNVVILDKSGSMSCIRKQALDGCNETIMSIKAAQEKYKDTQEHFFTLVLFCNCELKFIYDKTPIEKVHLLNARDYQPCCCTPLFDAIGHALSNLKYYTKALEESNVLATIITDGYENSSKEWSGKAVKALIDECKEDGWMIAFMGTMQDVEEVAASMSIDNVMQWKEDERGTEEAFEKNVCCSKRFYDRINEEVLTCPTPAERVELKRRISREFFKED